MAERKWTSPNRPRRPRRTCANGHRQENEGHALCPTCHTEFRYPSSFYTEEMIADQQLAHVHDFGLHRCSRGHFHSVDSSNCPRCADLPPTPPAEIPIVPPEPEPVPDPEAEALARFIEESGFTVYLGAGDVGVDPSYTGRVVYLPDYVSESASGSSGNAPQDGHNSQEPVAVEVPEQNCQGQRPIPLPRTQLPVPRPRTQVPVPEPVPVPVPIPRPRPQEPEAPAPTLLERSSDTWRTYTTGGRNIFVNSMYRSPFLMREPVFYATGWHAGPPRGGRGGGQRNGNRGQENGTQNQPVGEASTSRGSGRGRGTRRGRGTDRGHGSERGHGAPR